MHVDAATSPNRTSSDRDASMMQLMASMSSVGGAESLQDIWAMMETGLSPRPSTPRYPSAESMCGLFVSDTVLYQLFIFSVLLYFSDFRRPVVKPALTCPACFLCCCITCLELVA